MNARGLAGIELAPFICDQACDRKDRPRGGDDTMQSVVGIFTSRVLAENAAAALRAPEIAGNNVSVLTPETPHEHVEHVPTDEGESPGIGAALGAVVGAAAGATGGMTLATAAVVTLVPMVGPVLVTGLLAGVVLGADGRAAFGHVRGTHLPNAAA